MGTDNGIKGQVRGEWTASSWVIFWSLQALKEQAIRASPAGWDAGCA